MITFKKITLKSKAGLILINYSYAILDQEIQNNCGCPEAAGPDREGFLQLRKYQKDPHRSCLGNWLWVLIVIENPGLLLFKYREYLQKLYSLDTWCLTEQTNVLSTLKHYFYQIQPVIESIIQHARYGQQCCISAVHSLTPRHSKFQVFQQTRGAQNISKSFKKHHIYFWVFRLIFYSWFIWCPPDISRAFERTSHMTISSTFKFTNTLPYAWKNHRIDSTKVIYIKGVLTGIITWLLCFFPSFDRFIPGFDRFIPGFGRFIPASIPVTGTLPPTIQMHISQYNVYCFVFWNHFI